MGQARIEYQSKKELEKLAKNDPNIANAIQESIRSLELEQLAKNDPNIANAIQESIRSLELEQARRAIDELEQARRAIDEADSHAQRVISNRNYLELLKKYR